MHNKVLAPSLVGLLLATAACGGGSSAQDGSVTVALPFPSCLAWWPLYAAEDQGFFKDEGVKAKFEGLDGSAAAIQAALSGKAQVAMSAPDNYLSAAAEGASVTGWYGFYQSQTFFLVAPDGSSIDDLADLRDKTVGISTPGGGDVTYAESLLKLGADLDKDEDYKELAVGDGGAAATALESGAVDAYSASYFDEEIIKAGGMELTQLTSDTYPDVVGQIFVSTTEWAKDNPETVDHIGSAIAQGTAWGLKDPSAVVDICAEVNPEETEDRAFAETIVKRVGTMMQLPDSADGKYGYIDEDAWAAYRDLLIELKIVPEGAKDASVDNSHVDAWNE